MTNSTFKLMLWKTNNANAGDLLWQRVFDMQTLFEQFVHGIVNSRKQEGYMQAGERYSARIIPHYYRITDPALYTEIAADGSVPFGEAGQITAQLEGSANEAEEICSFTLLIRVVERPLVLKQDFDTYAVTMPFFRRLAPQLVVQGIMHSGDKIMPLLYRSDNSAAFGSIVIEVLGGTGAPMDDVLEVPSEVRSLVEILPDDDAAEGGLSVRSLSDYPNRERFGIVNERAPLQIVVAREALEQMRGIARADTRVEQGGILVGMSHINADVVGGFIVDVTNHILAESARGTHVQLRYTFEDWQRQTALLQAQYADKRVVGWYHTHLVKALRINAAGEKYFSELFFSEDDKFIHTQFFKERWYVALVLNPLGEPAFFNWSNDTIVEAQGFHLV